jgi:hypothetical protein
MISEALDLILKVHDFVWSDRQTPDPETTKISNCWVRDAGWKRDMVETTFSSGPLSVSIAFAVWLRGSDGVYYSFDTLNLASLVEGRTSFVLPGGLTGRVFGYERTVRDIADKVEKSVRWFDDNYASMEGFEKRIDSPERQGTAPAIARSVLAGLR